MIPVIKALFQSRFWASNKDYHQPRQVSRLAICHLALPFTQVSSTDTIELLYQGRGLLATIHQVIVSPVHTKLRGSVSLEDHQDLKCSNSPRLQRHLAQHSSSKPVSPISQDEH